jgi:CubicO group peptidase (beta-lactamase class C family)
VFTTRFLPPEAFPLSDPARAGIRLGELLAMTAGIRGNNPGVVNGKEVMLEPAGPDGWQALVDEMCFGKMDGTLNTKTLWTKPGGGYSYATCSPHLASVILRRAAGMELGQYIEERLAKPLGWGRWGWGYRRPEIRHTPGGGGVALRATDLLRFAYLLLREGRWENRQVVPAAYVRHCGRPSPYNPHSPYSLQFDVNAMGTIQGAPRDAFWKRGSGGHCFYIVPSLDLVVFKLGGRDDQYGPDDKGYEGSREGWTRSVDDETAAERTLELVIESIHP